MLYKIRIKADINLFETVPLPDPEGTILLMSNQGAYFVEIEKVERTEQALEKQIPKKINEHNRCPCCDTYNETIEKRRNTVKNDICYCWHCGQALKWEETKV